MICVIIEQTLYGMFWLKCGFNALHYAAGANHVETVKALVGEFGLSVTRRDNVS